MRSLHGRGVAPDREEEPFVASGGGERTEGGSDASERYGHPGDRYEPVVRIRKRSDGARRRGERTEGGTNAIGINQCSVETHRVPPMSRRASTEPGGEENEPKEERTQPKSRSRSSAPGDEHAILDTGSLQSACQDRFPEKTASIARVCRLNWTP